MRAELSRSPRHPLERPARQDVESFPEIDCIRHLLPPSVLVFAEQRAAALRVGADEVLIAAGYLSEQRYQRVLAASLGVRFAELDSTPRAVCPLSEDTLMQAAQAGMLPLLLDGELRWVLAPRGMAARHLVATVRAHPALRRRVLLCAPAQMRRFVQRHTARAIARHASDWLRTSYPDYSAATPRRPGAAVGMSIAAGVGAAMAAAALAPGIALAVLQVLISAVFLAWTGLRLLGIARSYGRKPVLPPPPLRDLPVYTIVVALYREARAVPGLVAALHALDYPAEKLDVKLVLETDDPQTRVAAEMLRLPPQFQIIFVPNGEPRTKPRALNAAMPFVRGEFVAVFDAEDRPEPDQLRRALAAFRNDRSRRLACVQARLSIDNTNDSWLTCLFTAEYAGQFDVLLPGLTALGLPIPLGGSSNHFPTAVLRDSGAWDAYNVTEDADLGTRLARFGYRVATIGSTTYEEAPAKVGPWLRQRTRWFKGWLQTWVVHMRHPVRLWRDLGASGFITFQLMLAGTVAAALLQPIAIGVIALAWLVGAPFSMAETLAIPGLDWIHGLAFAGGYATSVVLAFAGLARRKLLWATWALPLMGVHWALLSIAAWRALIQYLRDPFRWEKTEHGLARTSRRAGGNRR